MAAAIIVATFIVSIPMAVLEQDTDLLWGIPLTVAVILATLGAAVGGAYLVLQIGGVLP